MKIKIEVDGLTLEHATELTKFLSSLQTTNGVERYDKESFLTPVVSDGKPLEDKIIREVPNATKQTRKKAEKVEAPIAETPHDDEAEAREAIAQTKAEAIEVVEPETVSAPTLMQIRSLVAQKAGEHKDSIKSKLVELGAQNVSTLDPKHFQTIFDFLTKL